MMFCNVAKCGRRGFWLLLTFGPQFLDILDDLADVDVDRAGLHTSAAADAVTDTELLREVEELVGEPLSHADALVGTGIMATRNLGEPRGLAALPAPHAIGLALVGVIPDVEAVTGRADV